MQSKTLHCRVGGKRRKNMYQMLIHPEDNLVMTAIFKLGIEENIFE